MEDPAYAYNTKIQQTTKLLHSVPYSVDSRWSHRKAKMPPFSPELSRQLPGPAPRHQAPCHKTMNMSTRQ